MINRMFARLNYLWQAFRWHLLKWPATISSNAILQCYLSTGHTADGPIETVTNATIHIAQVELLETIVQRYITLDEVIAIVHHHRSSSANDANYKMQTRSKNCENEHIASNINTLSSLCHWYIRPWIINWIWIGILAAYTHLSIFLGSNFRFEK